MGKYRKKPVIVEARQWNSSTAYPALEIINWAAEEGATITFYCADEEACTMDNHTLKIQTLEGDMHASWNDYIIQGVQGEFYPCKPDIFEATYEEVTN